MTVLVTGASGFIGRHVVAALLAAGEDVVAPACSGEAAARVQAAAGAAAARPGVRVQVVAPDDVGRLRELARGCGRVVHLAGPYRADARTMVEAHVRGTRRLLDALEDGARVVHVSSTSVYGWERPWPADEATPPAPVTAYGRAKVRAEELVRAWPRGTGVVVRPTIVYGPGDAHGMVPRAWSVLRRARGRLVLPGDGRNRIHLLAVEDLVPALLAALDRGTGTYVVGGPVPTPIAHVLAVLADEAGVPPPRFAVPVGPARAGGAVLDEAWRLAGARSESPLSRHSVDVVTRDRSFSWRRADEDLGWRPVVDVEHGLRATARWLAAAAPAPAPGAGVAVHPSGANPGAPVVGAVAAEPGPPWRPYFVDPDEGLGTVYERFRLAEVIDRALELTGSRSVLHAPGFGMTGIPGLDAVFQARAGVPVAYADVVPERIAAVAALWRELDLPLEVATLPWPDTSGWAEALPRGYDLVVSFAALWWCPDPWRALAACTAVAERALMVSVPNRTAILAARERVWHRGMFDELRRDVMDPERFRAEAAALGLEVVEEGLLDLPPFPDTAVPLRQVLTAALRRFGGARVPPAAGAATGGAGVPPAGERSRGRSEERGAEPRREQGARSGRSGAATWRWSILPHLRGDDPDLPARMERLAVLERRLPRSVQERLANHRWYVLVRR